MKDHDDEMQLPFAKRCAYSLAIAVSFVALQALIFKLLQSMS